MGFRGSNASGRKHCASTKRILGARCFQNGHFGRIFSTLYFTVFQSLGGHASARRVSHEPCFCQAHCFVQGPLRFFPVLPKPTCTCSHIWGLPIKHFSDTVSFCRRATLTEKIGIFCIFARSGPNCDRRKIRATSLILIDWRQMQRTKAQKPISAKPTGNATLRKKSSAWRCLQIRSCFV